jgi:hypothetical protein
MDLLIVIPTIMYFSVRLKAGHRERRQPVLLSRHAKLPLFRLVWLLDEVDDVGSVPTDAMGAFAIAVAAVSVSITIAVAALVRAALGQSHAEDRGPGSL